MKASTRVVSPLIRGILGSICRVDHSELARVPSRGPLILVMNHINFLEVPLIYTYLHPRRIVGLVKRETWDNPLLAILGGIWEAIPLDRGGTDLAAMRRALDILAEGRILIVAPEGTRSGNGRLQQGHGGVIQLAARSGAPMLPIAHFGGERFWTNIGRPRRTRVAFRVGEACRLAVTQAELTRHARQEATDELMRRLARLLPEAYRGVYAGALDGPDLRLETV